MHNSLSGCLSFVDPNVVARWHMFAIDASLCRTNQTKNSGEFLWFQLEQIRNMTSDNDKCVSR